MKQPKKLYWVATNKEDEDGHQDYSEQFMVVADTKDEAIACALEIHSELYKEKCIILDVAVEQEYVYVA